MSMVVILIPFLSSCSSSFGGSGAGAVGAEGVGDGEGAGGGVLLFASVPFTRAIVRAIAVFTVVVMSYKTIRAWR